MTTYRILVVDDELLIRDLLYDFFAAKEWDVMVADGGFRAMDFLKNQRFDVVLTDLKMPDMNGLELTEKIRSLYGDLPVIIMTGYPSLDSAVAAIRHKVDDYVIKPFNVNQLFKTIITVVEGRRRGQETIAP
jgi:DNA-binding NtrC family response regulator